MSQQITLKEENNESTMKGLTINDHHNDILTTTIIEQPSSSISSEKKQKGWFYWFKADDDSEDEDFNDDTEGFSNKFIAKDWTDMNLFEKTLSIGEKLGYHVANILGITDSKFQVEKDEFESRMSKLDDENSNI